MKVSEQLRMKLEIKNIEKWECGKNSICRIYGGEVRLNEKNGLKFIALVNVLSGKR